ncbi:quinolinate synthase NadA [Patescibacteria group bacterium]
MLPEKYKALSDEQTLPLIEKAKQALSDKVLILGHHYQRDEVVQFADHVGDSLYLSQTAAKSKSPYIVFCGVRFMAETADMVTGSDKIVILPDLSAGCPMADMAPVDQIEKAWKDLEKIIDVNDVIPITYINSSAETKAFCGRHNGLVCTSANAENIIKWAFDQNKKIFFFPDRYLSSNVSAKIGLDKSQIALWDRAAEYGDLKEDQIKNARILVWNGYCPVHAKFKGEDIVKLREKNPNIKILVHPEVPEEVAEKSDLMGSTSFIVKTIQEAEAGSEWGIGTEIHLVSRLSKEHPDKKIYLIGTPICMCSMMDRISPQYLLWILESLNKGKVQNQINVNEDTKKSALQALDRMFELS